MQYATRTQKPVEVEGVKGSAFVFRGPMRLDDVDKFLQNKGLRKPTYQEAYVILQKNHSRPDFEEVFGSGNYFRRETGLGFFVSGPLSEIVKGTGYYSMSYGMEGQRYISNETERRYAGLGTMRDELYVHTSQKSKSSSVLRVWVGVEGGADEVVVSPIDLKDEEHTQLSAKIVVGIPAKSEMQNSVRGALRLD